MHRQNYSTSAAQTIASWDNQFRIIKQRLDEQGNILQEGLRTPQWGAFYEVMAHWSLSKEHGIIVMPTGTGKTDTMITIMVGHLCERILIIVPSLALRDQIARKFRHLGMLKQFKMLPENALPPEVGVIKKSFKTLDEIDHFFTTKNVIVSTASAFTNLKEGHLERMAANCSHLFLDEAHHANAPRTWEKIQGAFRKKPALLFTATPYRNDRTLLSGKMIYSYPLRKAQEENYFTYIEQVPIYEWDEASHDEAIAQKAITLLEEDLKSYPLHRLMARANRKERAQQIYQIYQQYPQYNPVLIHSDISKTERKQRLEKFISGESKIVVCVDMLGEGFDLPEIKIGAFHDFRKNLTTSLQLIGRYTRFRSDLGTAKFVYNAAKDLNIKELEGLVAKDADWNFLIPNLTEYKNQQEEELSKFVRSFNLSTNFPLQNVRPAFSLVAYKSDKPIWYPENFKQVFDPDATGMTWEINAEKNTLIIIAAEKKYLQWVNTQQLFDVEHHLYLLHWMKKEKLLLIHSSKTGSNYFKSLAKAILGKGCTLLCGESVFRSLHNVERVKFYGVGLREPNGKNVSFTQRIGKNVAEGVSLADLLSRTKKLIRGSGYEKGHKIDLGCTSNGRIWSFQRKNLPEMINWGREIAQKLTNESIDTGLIMKGVSIPVQLKSRPVKMPFFIEWPAFFYEHPDVVPDFKTSISGHISLAEISLDLQMPSVDGELLFTVSSSLFTATYKLMINATDFSIVKFQGTDVMVVEGETRLLTAFFEENPPIIYFADGSFLEGNQYTELKKSIQHFDTEKIIAWDWTGVNIKKESQGVVPDPTSIQYKLIEELKKKKYTIIFNDDDKGETADVITVRVDNRKMIIYVEQYHCKFSSKNEIGSRLKDLYEVCGQSQKNVRWLDNPYRFFKRLLERNAKWEKKHQISRIQYGTQTDLEIIAQQSKLHYSVELTVFAVQPGLSKAKGEKEEEILRLFAVSEDYIKTTKQGGFFVIASS